MPINRHFGLDTGYSIPIYGNPDAYIKTYADSNRKVKFSCLNHPNIVAVPAVAPNCMRCGYTAGTRCTVCGSYVEKPQRIEPNGQHSWDVQVLKKATVKHAGKRMYICTICWKSYVEEIPKLALPQKGKTITEPASDNDYKVTKTASKNGTVEFPSARFNPPPFRRSSFSSISLQKKLW